MDVVCPSGLARRPRSRARDRCSSQPSRPRDGAPASRRSLDLSARRWPPARCRPAFVPSRRAMDQAALAFDPLLFVPEELPEPELPESVDDFLASSLFEALLSLASVFVVDFESPAVDV